MSSHSIIMLTIIIEGCIAFYGLNRRALRDVPRAKTSRPALRQVRT
jgi:hypothetical protein